MTSARRPAVEVEDAYIVEALRSGRERDRAAGRALEGPHRSDLVVAHGPKGMAAHISSTGEQKALLVGVVLAHAELVKQRHGAVAPILLLDEIAAHLDRPPARRAVRGDRPARQPGLDDGYGPKRLCGSCERRSIHRHRGAGNYLDGALGCGPSAGRT